VLCVACQVVRLVGQRRRGAVEGQLQRPSDPIQGEGGTGHRLLPGSGDRDGRIAHRDRRPCGRQHAAEHHGRVQRLVGEVNGVGGGGVVLDHAVDVDRPERDGVRLGAGGRRRHVHRGADHGIAGVQPVVGDGREPAVVGGRQRDLGRADILLVLHDVRSRARRCGVAVRDHVRRGLH